MEDPPAAQAFDRHRASGSAVPGPEPLPGLFASAQAAAAEREADQVDKYPRPSAAGPTRQRSSGSEAASGALRERPGSGSGKRSRSSRQAPTSLRRRVYAETGYFDCRGIAQGRRGHRCPPDRFARLPHHERAARMGRSFVTASFLLTGRGRFLFDASKRKRGRIPCGDPAPLPGPPGKGRHLTIRLRPVPLIRPAFSRPPSPGGGRLSRQGRGLAGASQAGIPSSLRPAAIHLTVVSYPRGRALRRGLQSHFRQKRGRRGPFDAAPSSFCAKTAAPATKNS